MVAPATRVEHSWTPEGRNRPGRHASTTLPCEIPAGRAWSVRRQGSTPRTPRTTEGHRGRNWRHPVRPRDAPRACRERRPGGGNARETRIILSSRWLSVVLGDLGVEPCLSHRKYPSLRSSRTRSRPACCRCRCAAGRSMMRTRPAHAPAASGSARTHCRRPKAASSRCWTATVPAVRRLPSVSAWTAANSPMRRLKATCGRRRRNPIPRLFDHAVPAGNPALRVIHIVVAQPHVQRRQRRRLLPHDRPVAAAAAPDRSRRSAHDRPSACPRDSAPSAPH